MKIHVKQIKTNDKFRGKNFVDSGFVITCDELVIGHTTKKEKHFVHQELKKKQELLLVVKNWNVEYVQKYSKERKA